MNILVIEDDTGTLSFLKNSLKEEGFVVDTASDGKTGLQKALTNTYDLIILDNILPGLTGPEICRKIREKRKTDRILMLSVNGKAEIKAKVLDLGADDYLSKPFSFQELLSRIRALLRRPEKIKGETLKINNFILDSKNKTFFYTNKEIPLTPKEFSLLEYLMRNQGRVVSRIEILEHVWDVNADLFTNTVEMHISKLRKKISQFYKKTFIHTVAGSGYRIS